MFEKLPKNNLRKLLDIFYLEVISIATPAYNVTELCLLKYLVKVNNELVPFNDVWLIYDIFLHKDYNYLSISFYN